LFAAFDTSVGVVSGSGTGSMQFGAARLLLVLQAADNTPEAAARASEFKLVFGVNDPAVRGDPSGAARRGVMAVATLVMAGAFALLSNMNHTACFFFCFCWGQEVSEPIAYLTIRGVYSPMTSTTCLVTPLSRPFSSKLQGTKFHCCLLVEQCALRSRFPNKNKKRRLFMSFVSSYISFLELDLDAHVDLALDLALALPAVTLKIVLHTIPMTHTKGICHAVATTPNMKYWVGIQKHKLRFQQGKKLVTPL
jgi:hypothetical protein